jgi:hypothetical protein
MVYSLRGQLRPREGAGQLPALLLVTCGIALPTLLAAYAQKQREEFYAKRYDNDLLAGNT